MNPASVLSLSRWWYISNRSPSSGRDGQTSTSAGRSTAKRFIDSGRHRHEGSGRFRESRSSRIFFGLEDDCRSSRLRLRRTRGLRCQSLLFRTLGHSRSTRYALELGPRRWSRRRLCGHCTSSESGGRQAKWAYEPRRFVIVDPSSASSVQSGRPEW